MAAKARTKPSEDVNFGFLDGKGLELERSEPFLITFACFADWTSEDEFRHADVLMTTKTRTEPSEDHNY